MRVNMRIKIVFHERYLNSRYAMDPAAAEGRLNGIMNIVKSKPELYEIITSEPAGEADEGQVADGRLEQVDQPGHPEPGFALQPRRLVQLGQVQGGLGPNRLFNAHGLFHLAFFLLRSARL